MIKYYAVIDTNVIVSSFIKSNSVPDAIVKMALNGPIKPLVNDEILSKYTESIIKETIGLFLFYAKLLLVKHHTRIHKTW